MANSGIPQKPSPMRLGLSTKLFLAVFALVVVVVLAMSAGARLSFSHGFLGYLAEQETERLESSVPTFAAAYAEHGNWDFVRNNHQAWFQMMRPQRHGSGSTGQDGPPVSDLTGANMRFTLLDAEQRYVFGNPHLDQAQIRRPIVVAGKTVGWLCMTPFRQVSEVGDLRFQESQFRSMWIVGACAVTLAALIALWLARTLLRPVREVAAATHALAAGDYAARVDPGATDDLGRLARDFNQLALALERTEQQRRQFVANVSHELRTPLAVMHGELEAIEDGVRPMDGSAVGSLQHEVRVLNKLVDDLYELSLADVGAMRYRKVDTDLVELIEQTARGFRERLARADIALELRLPDPPLIIYADENRLHQLFANLIENSVRYTDRGGSLRIQCRRENAHVVIDVLDSAPGVDPDLLPRLFDRFFRVESSRNRATGGAGLGLAICLQIVEAHGGSIEARRSPMGGLWLSIRLPVEGS